MSVLTPKYKENNVTVLIAENSEEGVSVWIMKYNVESGTNDLTPKYNGDP